MDKYYHFTSCNCIDGIVENGLIPQTGFRSMTKLDERCGVFLSKGIFNSIYMYASMLMYYDVHKNNGIQEIENCKQDIAYLEYLKSVSDNKLPYDIQIREAYQAIDIINNILNCNTFVDYLDGEGYFLAVNELDSFVSKSLEDCCYNNIIPPSNINIVMLRNYMTGHNIDSRELIVSYLINTTPNHILLNTIKDENMLNNLRRYISQYNMNFDGYELKEVAFDFYNYKCKKIRPFIFTCKKNIENKAK